MMDQGNDNSHLQGGMPRWMIWAFAGKMAAVVAIVGAVLWWANA